jgi:opacity protein-like surface antigen
MCSSGREHGRSAVWWIALGAAAWFTLAEAGGAAQAEWSASVEQRTSYTTDAFQFSSARRLALSEDPSQPTVVPVEKPDDVIWEPALEVIRGSSNSLGKNELSFKARGAIYTNNPIFDHGDYRIQDRQWLDSDTSILLRYRYVPNLFLGPNFERQTGTFSVQDERVTSHHWRAEFERRLNEELNAALIGRYGLRLYNDAFSERDTQFFTVGPRFQYRPTNWMTVTLGYLYERGLADGRQETQFKDDVSYYLYTVSFGTEFQISSRLALNLVYLHLRKTFTSDLVGDSHMDRRDFTNQGLAELRYHLTLAAAATLGFQQTQRTSTNALRGFNDTIVSVGGQYQF